MRGRTSIIAEEASEEGRGRFYNGCLSEGEEVAYRKGGLSEKGKGIVCKICEGQNAYYVSFLNFPSDLINYVYSMTFFGKNPVISN